MQAAGWDMDQPLSIENSLFALTGQDVKSWYPMPSSNPITKDSFGEEIIRPILGDIAVLFTKKDHSVPNVKHNYAYAILPEAHCASR